MPIFSTIGFLARDCQRLVSQDRNFFGACMVVNSDADAMITGVNRAFSFAFNEISRVVDPLPDQRLMGISLVVGSDRSLFIADTRIHKVTTAYGTHPRCRLDLGITKCRFRV
tara:strand:- start:104 stop:439 length:336 start_codon:yes stop_codon:yes gene_type:complete